MAHDHILSKSNCILNNGKFHFQCTRSRLNRVSRGLNLIFNLSYYHNLKRTNFIAALHILIEIFDVSLDLGNSNMPQNGPKNSSNVLIGIIPSNASHPNCTKSTPAMNSRPPSSQDSTCRYTMSNTRSDVQTPLLPSHCLTLTPIINPAPAPTSHPNSSPPPSASTASVPPPHPEPRHCLESTPSMNETWCAAGKRPIR